MRVSSAVLRAPRVPETRKDEPDPRDEVLAKIRALGPEVDRLGNLDADHCRPKLLRFATRERQRINSVVFDAPWIVLILDGTKRLLSPEKCDVRAGHAFLTAPNVSMDTVSIPDSKSGIFHALCVEILGDAHALVRRHYPELGAAMGPWFGERPIVVRPDLLALQAALHVCETVLAPDFHPRLLHHRLEGLLLSLLVKEKLPPTEIARTQAQTDVVVAVQNLVRAAPESEWSADDIARRLSLSAATLRRKLAREGTSLRQVILRERMSLARVLLTDGRLDVGEVALRCGYESQAKFARQFARSFGHTPSAARRGSNVGERTFPGR